MVWQANAKTGRLDPSQELLAAEANVHVKTVADAHKRLRRAGFVTLLRRANAHRSAAFQIEWEMLAEAQARWELQAFATLEDHKRLRAERMAAYRAKAIGSMRRSDIIPPQMRCAPVKRRGVPPSTDSLKRSNNPPSFDSPNSFEPFEENSLKAEARLGEPLPQKRNSPSRGNKEAFKGEIGKRAETSPPPRPPRLLAPVRDGWERRGETDGSTTHPLLEALNRWEARLDEQGPIDDHPHDLLGRGSNAWSKSTILGDEPRDLAEFPLEEEELAA
jgi:DNA-binding transcriptional regulator YhcF (GntR family)